MPASPSKLNPNRNPNNKKNRDGDPVGKDASFYKADLDDEFDSLFKEVEEVDASFKKSAAIPEFPPIKPCQSTKKRVLVTDFFQSSQPVKKATSLLTDNRPRLGEMSLAVFVKKYPQRLSKETWWNIYEQLSGQLGLLASGTRENMQLTVAIKVVNFQVCAMLEETPLSENKASQKSARHQLLDLLFAVPSCKMNMGAKSELAQELRELNAQTLRNNRAGHAPRCYEDSKPPQDDKSLICHLSRRSF